MKKILVSSFVGLFVLTACSIMDLFVDKVEVHNALVQKMDAVLVAEENFFNEYWSLVGDVDITPFAEAYDDFKTAVDELDVYFSETRFASDQKVFIEEYNDYYKSFIYGYLEYAEEFADRIEDEGYTFEAMEPYFEDLDDYTVEFVETHNKLIGAINVQSDYATTGQTY